MKKVRFLHRYSNPPRGLYFEPGDIRELDNDVVAFLAIDSPESFQLVKPRKKKTKSTDSPKAPEDDDKIDNKAQTETVKK